ncbi:hypothetical protein EU513_02305 [Yimella sp. RIT 621]|uniref:type ISP restriction/modification enzyme n=1 Tax=Yimella sp. RIT 621 TaxID=2510323 RepID=UPI00101D8FDC|nr:type ISP restriction/modification enzyme [Yimella sp. RIT 621]RYG78463.1 hypothetical protein EU513_02305 [Yimella sp. RIT 621]
MPNESVPDLFAAFVSECKSTLAIPGASAELSVTGKLDNFLSAALPAVTARTLHVSQQAGTDFGIPDFRVDSGNELLGWIEFKAVTGKDLTDLKGHDKKQRELFVAGLHNLILTDGWQWELYQDSRRVKKATFERDTFTTDTILPTDPKALDDLHDLLGLFASFQLGDYTKVDTAVVALASRAKAIKLALIELGPSNAGSHLNQLRSDFGALLYRNGQPFTWEKFVDSYVQIAAFGALLWHLESGQDISLTQQVGLKPGVHPLLAQCLAILWSPQSQVATLKPLLEELCRTVNLIPPTLFTSTTHQKGRRKYVPDPIVHAYEPFFRRYDQAAREANGVYYTPVEIVQQIVSGVDELIRTALSRPDGILDEDARFLDPATGTGTFLLGLANEIAHEAGKSGLPTDQVVSEVLTTRTSAFELFPGPYTIAHQRLEALLAAQGVPPTQRLPIYLADTLAAPESGQLPVSGFGPAGDEILAERQRADWIKTGEEILVILGNPPYERVKTANGGWDVFAAALMQEVVNATPVDRRADLKSATDLYVAFWAWSLWALRDPKDRQATAQLPTIDTTTNHGIVAYVTNRTWIIGPSLVGLRRLVRKGVKEVWVYDLGGDARGGSGARSFAGGDVNVFGIQTGVAIVWLVFDKTFHGEPTVRYRRMFGKKADKLAALADPFDASAFETVDGDDLFVPVHWPAALADAPTLTEMFRYDPFTGIQSARDTSEYSPWAVDRDGVYSEVRAKPSAPVIKGGNLGRWAALTDPQRRAGWSTAQSTRSKKAVPDKNKLSTGKVRKALYRPLDSRHVYDDPAWIDWYRDELHAVYAAGDVPTLISLPRDLGAGPLAIHTDLLPDQHSFKGQAGGKGVFPLWLPGDGQPDDGRTIVGGRRCGLSDAALGWAHRVFPESLDPAQNAYDYTLAILSAPAYAERYWPELEASAPRVPLTDDEGLAADVAALGRRTRTAWRKEAPTTGLKWEGKGHGPVGAAELVGTTLRFANGRTITGIPHGVWSFMVSNYRVLPEWLAARAHWTATISQAGETLKTIAAVSALADLATELNAAFDRVVGPGTAPTPAFSDVAVRRDEVRASGTALARVTNGDIGLPLTDVSIDIDCEHKDGHVYLWGATLTGPDDPDGTYRAFANWSTDYGQTEEAQLADEFVGWISQVTANARHAGHSIGIYHYGPTEPANLQRVLSGDKRIGALEDNMVDLLKVVRDHFDGVAGTSLKAVAATFGATWRTVGASGADTLTWIDMARASGPEADQARARLVAYNEDDTTALGALRKGLRDGGPTVR